MTERQMMIESLTSRLNYLSDDLINSLLNLLNAIEITEDEANYITYGKDATEHILSNPANAERLNKAIEAAEQGLNQPVIMTLETFESLVNDH
jgi:hypothetical protein